MFVILIEEKLGNSDCFQDLLLSHDSAAIGRFENPCWTRQFTDHPKGLSSSVNVMSPLLVKSNTVCIDKTVERLSNPLSLSGPK